MHLQKLHSALKMYGIERFRMRYAILYRIMFFCIAATLVCGLSGCGNSEEREKSGISISEQKDVEIGFSVDSYVEKISDARIAIGECQAQYEEEINSLRRETYDNVSFGDCEFSEFPETEQLNVLVGLEHGITTQESLDTIENWLNMIGKYDEIDINKEIRVATEQFETDDSVEYPYNYVSFLEHISELDSGAGAFLDTNKCHIQIAGNGIYSMSDGKITEYLGETSKVALDALGIYSGETIAEGTLDELGSEKYELMTGELSVQEGADLVKEYFMAGTPFPCEEGVTVDIPEVAVFKLGDVYGYDYIVRRIYNSVPFAYKDYGTFHGSEDYSVDEDIKHAYVVDDSGVSAFSGFNESERLVTLLAGDKIISLEQMAEMLSRDLASYLEIQVKYVDFVYAPIKFSQSDDPNERIILPCWELMGRNMVKDENIRIYVDAFTGEIYYYTFGD